MEHLRFTEATPELYPVVADILTEATKIKNQQNDHAWGTAGWSTQEVQGLAGHSTTYVVYSDEQAVATVSLQWEDEQSWGVQPQVAGYMHRLAIRQDMTGQGLGEVIVNWAIKQTAAKGKELLRLDCPADNEKLCAYYERLGFVRVGVTEDTGHEGYVAALYERAVR